MKGLRVALGLLLAIGFAVTGVIVALGGVAVMPAEAAPKAKPPAAAAPRVHRMTAVLAYEPAWLPDSKRLAFFGNRGASEPHHLYVWEPLTGQIGRATQTAVKRHSLAVADDGRLAYVEHQDAPDPTQLRGGSPAQPQPGPDTLIIHDLKTHATQAVFTGGWVLPRSVAWSPDGKRLAFVTLDGAGQQRLALVAPGQPVALVQLDRPYELQALVGWANDREVLLRGSALEMNAPGPERLLLIGRAGVRTYRAALDPKLSPDGRWLLAKQSESGGVTLRLVSGGSRILNTTANAYDWAPEADRVYAAVDRDLVALDLKGKVLRRWSGLANLALGQVNVSPDGKLLAFSADYGLAVLGVK